MKPTKAVQVLARKLYEVGTEARCRFDEREGRSNWKELRYAHRIAWYAIAEYVIQLIGSEEKGR
jgi:hypothetical protein